MADDEHRNDATDRQRDAGERRGEPIPGKGFDGGGGYGGAGNSSAYDSERSYGGESGDGGNTQRGAYGGERYPRQGEHADEAAAVDGSDDAHTGHGSAFDGGEGGFDRDSSLGGERRDPGR